ncbi:MAG: hypothetical protein V1791_08970, partial [Pseudomonadota bacterium]
GAADTFSTLHNNSNSTVINLPQVFIEGSFVRDTKNATDHQASFLRDFGGVLDPVVAGSIR